LREGGKLRIMADKGENNTIPPLVLVDKRQKEEASGWERAGITGGVVATGLFGANTGGTTK